MESTWQFSPTYEVDDDDESEQAFLLQDGHPEDFCPRIGSYGLADGVQ
jgi:hypothetical protein